MNPSNSPSPTPDQSAIARGLDVTLNHPGEVVRLMRVLHDLARRSIDEKSVAPLMDFTYANMNLALKRVAHIQIACRAGCAHCCHGFVAASAPEVLHVAKGFAPEQLPQVRAAVAAIHAVTGGKTTAERERMVTPCALLKDNLCSVYESRPISCRTGVSIRADICERAHIQISGEAIPKPVAYVTMRRAYYIAFAGALKRAGLNYRAYEYNAGLNHALTEPGAEADWLAGRDIFKGLPEDLGGDVFAEANIRNVYDAAFEKG